MADQNVDLLRFLFFCADIIADIKKAMRLTMEMEIDTRVKFQKYV